MKPTTVNQLFFFFFFVFDGEIALQVITYTAKMLVVEMLATKILIVKLSRTNLGIREDF